MMKKFVMATMLCIGMGAGNSAMAEDVAGDKYVDFVMQMMGDTCAIAAKVVITDKLNGVSQQQAKDTFQEKFLQEFNKRDSDSKAINLVNLYALANNPKKNPEVANNSSFDLVKMFLDRFIPFIQTGAWQMDINNLGDKDEINIAFPQAMKEFCETNVYETLKEASGS